MKRPYLQIQITTLLLAGGLLLPAIAAFASDIQRRDVGQPLAATIAPEAVDRFLAAVPGDWRVQHDGRTGAVRSLSGAGTRSYGPEPQAGARQFLREHGELFGAGGQTTFEPIGVRTTRHGHRVVMAQYHAGLPVVGGRVTVVLDDLGSVVRAASGAQPIGPLDLEPAIDAAAALAAAAIERPGAGERGAQLAIDPRSGGRLVWLVSHRDINRGHLRPWTVMIDARTGDVLESRTLQLDADDHNAHDDHAAHGKPLPTAARERLERASKAQAIPYGAPMTPPPCEREWITVGPEGETIITGGEYPLDPYQVTIELGTSSFGASFEDGQASAMYGAGITLHPCYDYTITIDYTLFTWDSYSAGEGAWDVFFVNANPVGFLWDLATADPLGDRSCDVGIDEPGSPIPGPIVNFGGLSFIDEILCSAAGTISFMVSEPFEDELLYLSVGLDTAITGTSDTERPSWGVMTITITAATKIFDPNPVATTGDPSLSDDDDADGAVPCPAYTPIVLANLDIPLGPDEPWFLSGPWVTSVDLSIPAECAGYADLGFVEPTSHNGEFAYLRGCDAFEAVMTYAHIDAMQTYIQSLGFSDVNARQIAVDPHAFAEWNAFYCPDGFGTGELYFGDGGGDVDSAEDAEVILHEYAHSIQDNQMPDAWLFSGDNNCNGNETRAWGEGFSDAWALLHFAATKEMTGGDPFKFAQWFGSVEGLRNAGNDKTYPEDMEGAIHTDGEIISGAIMEIYMVLRDFMPEPAARAEVQTMLLDANFLVPPSPDFGDAAEAMIAGDFFATGGANVPIIAGTFEARGILRVLSVDAIVDGLEMPVTVTVPTDVLGQASAAIAPTLRLYQWGESVVVTAPDTFDGVTFSHWLIAGYAREAGVTTVELTMRGARTAEAVYLTDPISVGDTVLAQQSSDVLEPGAGPICTDGLTSQFTAFARAYDLGADVETAGAPFIVRSVECALDSNSGRVMEAEVRLYLDTDGGAPVGVGTDLTFLDTATLYIPLHYAGGLLTATFDPPIEVPADSTLVVEMALPKHCQAHVYSGANTAGESAPTYVRALACGVDDFITLSAFGFPGTSWIQKVNGDAVVVAIVGDIDGNGTVGFSDLVALLAAWGPCPACPADLDGDGTVGFSDLLILLAAWS